MTQIMIVVCTAVLAVAVLVALNFERLQPATATVTTKYPVGVNAGGQPYKGSPGAPIKIVEFADFACIHCADFARSLDVLAPDYIESGKIQVVFRNFALRPETEPAAEAAECALDQGADKFWAYHDLLYSMQGRGGSALSIISLKAYAGQLNLDTAAFDRCLDSGAKAAAVKTDRDDGVSSGVTGTPAWFINGELMPGALPENQLREVFDQALAKGNGQ